MEQSNQRRSSWDDDQYKSIIAVRPRQPDIQPQDIAAFQHPLQALLCPLSLEQVLKRLEQVDEYVEYPCRSSALVQYYIKNFIRPRHHFEGGSLAMFKDAPLNIVRAYFSYGFEPFKNKPDITLLYITGPKAIHDKYFNFISANLDVVTHATVQLDPEDTFYVAKYQLTAEKPPDCDGRVTRQIIITGVRDHSYVHSPDVIGCEYTKYILDYVPNAFLPPKSEELKQ